ncbi:MAG: hypothetical protein D6732_25980 [Methanobacteriota archaeon]|nr:MAG: hypothetical protein D6732_25980 [Euryarchaeota archaeon]
MRAEDQLGSIAPGKKADLVITGVNPLEDITVFEIPDELKVMKGGRWMRN